MIRSVVRQLLRARRHFAPYEVLVLGDSHARVFRHWWFAVAFPLTRFRVCVVGGATASGLENPNSKTQAWARFRDELNAAPGRRVICVLGEVDTAFVIWLRAQRNGVSVAETLTQTLEHYARFLSEVRATAASVVVLSAPLPTIGEGVPRGEIANMRREVTATRLQRTELTLEFNRKLGPRCRELGIQFVDLDAASLGPDGQVRATLLNSDPTDHHFAFEPYARLLCRQLRPLLR